MEVHDDGPAGITHVAGAQHPATAIHLDLVHLLTITAAVGRGTRNGPARHVAEVCWAIFQTARSRPGQYAMAQ